MKMPYHLYKKVKKIYGDGRCLLRSITVACDTILSCSRNERGWIADAQVASQETEKADELRRNLLKNQQDNL